MCGGEAWQRESELVLVEHREGGIDSRAAAKETDVARCLVAVQVVDASSQEGEGDHESAKDGLEGGTKRYLIPF